jgi:hypothetical protein
MTDTTSILDLPTDPVSGGTANNITMKVQEMPSASAQPPASSMTLDQSTINQIVNGLQQAKLSGATQLTSRDIPMSTAPLQTDPQIIPNYIPPVPPQQIDYINHVQHYNKMEKDDNDTSLDDMYNEIQTPLLITILYFLFQLPFFKKFLYTNLSFLFSNDGNYNLNGYVFTSILFGMMFHFLMKTTKYFGTF